MRELNQKENRNHMNTNRTAVTAGKRRIARRNNLIRCGLVISIAMAFIIVISCFVTVNASDSGHEKEPVIRYYTSISIESDATLWNIAQEYNNGEESDTHYINSIKELNNMSSDTLYSGQNLIVYYFSAEVKN